MDTTTCRVAGARAARVQSLDVPDWLRKELEAQPKRPPDAVTVEMYAKAIGRQRARASVLLEQRVQRGELQRWHDGKRFWFWPKGKS